MKKALLILLIITLAGGALLAFTACSGNAVVPGAAWAKTEILKYEIKDETGTVIGELVTTIEKLEKGSYTLDRVREAPFEITSASTKGMRYTQTATMNGTVVMESESLMNGFSSLASYKKVDYNGEAYTLCAYVDGKYYKYRLDDGAEKKVKIKTGFIDNELLYAVPRVYSEIDAGYSLSATVIDPKTGAKESFSIQALGVDTASKLTFDTVTAGGAAGDPATVSLIKTNIAKTTAPVGTGMTVYYSEVSYKLNGKAEFAGNYSYHLPVIIIENNLTYTLTSAQAM